MTTPNDVRWLDDDERQMWIAFAATLEVLPAALDAQLKRDADLTRYEYMILARLSEEPDGVVAMADLAVFLAGSISRLSHALGRLERQALVERRPAPEGGKRVDVHLRPAGRRRVVDAAPGHVTAVRELVFDVLSPTQVRQLARISRVLLTSVSPSVAAEVDDVVRRTGAGD